MIDLSLAERLLDYGARLRDQPARAREQLEGAVALHNLLERHGVAYLADEVGMGKTLVALGTLALFRHLAPTFRALIVAPKENLQDKWAHELATFVSYNVRERDLRVKGLDGGPARAVVTCGNLLHLVHEATADPDRDFVVRLPSFSLTLGGRDGVDPEAGRRLREGLRRALPWLPDDRFDLRSKEAFKLDVARAACCALPVFDLVIIDEGHNLRHGAGASASDRNRVLAALLGRSDAAVDRDVFRGYGPRARRVLFLSATPVEETYTHLWNQLDVVGKASPEWRALRDETDDERLRETAARLVVRRVTAMRVGAEILTKNLYRREWRRGGVTTHDEPMRVEGVLPRLATALVQKKVSELLGHEHFQPRFQIGMLASFESFLETAKVERAQEVQPTFDDAEQADELDERLGIDVRDVNDLARSHRATFGRELPHPKMDALVAALARAWDTGRKALVFVRRVASVGELTRKLNERYDTWLLARLRAELPPGVLPRFERAAAEYGRARAAALDRRSARGDAEERAAPSADDEDAGGADSFFAWFFRGEGPPGVMSGANIRQRFEPGSSARATFFLDNAAADVLGCDPDEVEARLARVVGAGERVRGELAKRARRFLTRAARPKRAALFVAVQAAAIEWLQATPGDHQARARAAWHELHQHERKEHHALEAPDVGDLLEQRTFFTELRRRPDLRAALWPSPKASDVHVAFREQTLRGLLLAAAARLGHTLVDLYVLSIRRLGSMDARTREALDQDPAGAIDAFLDLLDAQRAAPAATRDFRAFDELAELARCFDLVIDMNASEVRSAPLSTAAKAFGTLFGAQRPVGGMSGQVNKTLVRQFRLPGYPLVLVTTDLLQEGEDLHPFCSDVYHYGISWTPSAMEQRVGRIDRVRSQTDRRLAALQDPLPGDDKLQVYIPHLEDTVEVLQVERVLERMDTFVRLMHRGLGEVRRQDRQIDIDRAFADDRRSTRPRIQEPLESAFPIDPALLRGDVTTSDVAPDLAPRLLVRLAALAGAVAEGVTWEPPDTRSCELYGTAEAGGEPVSLTLTLRALEGRPVARGVVFLGKIGREELEERLDAARDLPSRLAAIETEVAGELELTAEDEALLRLDDPDLDAPRVVSLVRRLLETSRVLEVAVRDSTPLRVREARRPTAAADWTRRCASRDLKRVDEGVVEVRLADRRHRVTLEVVDDELRLVARVAGAAAVRDVPDLAQRLALRNRVTSVVGFRIDARGRVVGEARVATVGLDDAELRLVVRRTAVECDRLEFELTGRDEE